MTRSFWALVGFYCLGSAGSVQAHEYWLLAEDYTIEASGQLRVAQMNGEKMAGANLPYQPNGLKRFEVVVGDTVTPVVARLGDTPALAMAAPGEGLAIVVAQTAKISVRYQEFAKFESFARHKGLPEVVDLHRSRGLPETGFAETYVRFAKSLVSIGAGAGSDRAMGLRIEIVAQENPYQDDMTDGMTLQVLLDGQPRASAQLSLFETAADGVVSETFHVTDANGMVTVPAKSGSVYLADSVDLFALPNDDINAGPLWHSDWASLTYMIP